jgi:hypothetical protein
MLGTRPQRATAGKSPDRLSPVGLGKGGRARVLSEGDKDNLTKQARSLERRVGVMVSTLFYKHPSFLFPLYVAMTME